MCVLTGLFLAVITGIKVYYLQPVITGSAVIPVDTGFVTVMTFLIIGLVTAGMGIKATQKWKEQEFTSLPQQAGRSTNEQENEK
jgi:hypothetical protein